MDREYEGANRDLRWSMLGPSTWETEAGGWLDWSTLNYVIRTFQNQNLTKQYLVFGHLMCSPEAGFSHMWKNLRLKREACFALICLCSLKWRLKPSTYPLSACYMNRSCWFKKKKWGSGLGKLPSWRSQHCIWLNLSLMVSRLANLGSETHSTLSTVWGSQGDAWGLEWGRRGNFPCLSFS